MSGLQAVRVVGGIVPPSFLTRVQSGEVDRASLTPASYRLAGNETLRDAAARAWTYLRGAWSAWNDLDAPGAGATRDRWLLPLLRELGYGNVPALSHGLTVEDTSYPVSHCWEHVPVHLLGPGVDLDRRNPGVAGAARAPQAMLQELLNRSSGHLWAILSNGSKLRLLRDSTALAGSAYLEFDLDAIFDGELYSEFLLLFLVAHSTRLEKRSGSESGPSDCWVEAWRNDAVDTGTRALDRLRAGVEDALTQLGDGFLHHPSNRWLVDALRAGELTDRDYLRALLRLVYRLLFTFVAEDRGALLDPDAPTSAKTTYTEYFSTTRLRRLSRIRAGGPHEDLWRAQRLILEALGGEGLSRLAVPALGGLFDPDPREPRVTGQPVPDLLLGAGLSNHALLSAVRSLAWVEVRGGRTQPVDYRNLGAEELGSVYESLLELIPRVDLSDMTFRLETTAGNDRKTTGSYYTPPGLVSALLDTALDPLLDDAVSGAAGQGDAESRLLALTVCDPACGSGGFLVAAARRIARRLAQVRSGEDEPTPEAVQHALRDVIGRCIYGVDLNDLAAELAKVSLWLEAMEPGKPLGFLDARIRVGNALLGTTPALMADGIPDNAFKEIDGDDKRYATLIRKQNKAERVGQSSLFGMDNTISTHTLVEQRDLLLAPAETVDDARRQVAAWLSYEASSAVRSARLQADAWCSAFVWPLSPGAVPPVTDDVLRQLAQAPDTLELDAQVAEIERLAGEYQFFHWHLEFPEIFSTDEPTSAHAQGGFSCLLGNPPWMRVKLQEESYFKAVAPKIAEATNASVRKRMIAALETEDPILYDAYRRDLRRAEALSHFLGASGRYPLGGVGDINTYAVFADLMRQSITGRGRVGVILPSGLVSGFTYRRFVQELLESRTLVGFLGMENEDRIFPDVHNMTKFGLLTLSGTEWPVDEAVFVANARQPEQLLDPARRYTLSTDDIRAINPNSLTIPAFRWARDAEVTAAIHRAAPVLIRHDPPGNPWGVEFMRMFDMANDSVLFEPHEEIAPRIVRRDAAAALLDDGRTVFPLYEGKMLWHFDHRYGTYDGQTQAQANKGVLPHVDDATHDDPAFRIQPRYWVEARHVDERGWWTTRPWSMTFRDIGPAERTFLPTVVPPVAAGHKAPLLWSPVCAREMGALTGLLSSLVVDYDARQRGQLMSYFVLEQLAVLEPEWLRNDLPWLALSPMDWIAPRALELLYTNQELLTFARACEDEGEPYRWSAIRRRLLQCEIDAAVLHLYGLDRTQSEWLLDSFTVLRKYEEAPPEKGGHGEFLTKRLVLEYYDLMDSARRGGSVYASPIDPPPGQGPRHPRREE
jgi:hypothetical protein